MYFQNQCKVIKKNDKVLENVIDDLQNDVKKNKTVQMNMVYLFNFISDDYLKNNK